jgi:hypothetical protein
MSLMRSEGMAQRTIPYNRGFARDRAPLHNFNVQINFLQ